MTTDENGTPTAGMAESIIAKHRNGEVTDCKLRFLKEQARFADLDAGEGSTAADRYGGGAPAYREIPSSIGSEGEFGGGLG